MMTQDGKDMIAVIAYVAQHNNTPLNQVIAHFTEPLIPLHRLSAVLMEMIQGDMLELTVDRKLRLPEASDDT